MMASTSSRCSFNASEGFMAVSSGCRARAAAFHLFDGIEHRVEGQERREACRAL